MKITVFGTGYVGLVTGTCLADVGHQVLCMDVDQKKIKALQDGIVPIHEPGLAPLVQENLRLGTLAFTTNAAEAVRFGEVLIIAVGTPPGEDGSADLSHVLAVAGTIGEHMDADRTVITKSTVPVGTADKVQATIHQALAARGAPWQAAVASNPEFLKEGAAVADFTKPDRIIVGTDSDAVRRLMEELYAPFNRSSNRMIFMDIRSAELTKYAANAMLATKISFINEIANLAERLGADVEQVRQGIGSDPRIGYQFIYPGCGFGGSCFPKDVRALVRTAAEVGYPLSILPAVEAVNQRQKQRLFDLICHHYQVQGPGAAPTLDAKPLSGKTFAVWGLAFKPNTDDLREAPSRDLLEALWAAGARVQAYDPEAMEALEQLYGQRPDLTLLGTRDTAVQGADALVICTEWQHFRAPDFALLAKALRDQVIFDGRNLYDPARVSARGLTYYAIGRGASVKKGPDTSTH